MAKTSIEWTDHSVNPIRVRRTISGAVGHYCEKVSSGCANCYASTFQPRFGLPAFGKVKTELPEDIEVFLDESVLEKVRRRRKPTKYFWCDMTDMFGWWVPDEWIVDCVFTMKETPQHTHQILTKRPERAAEFIRHWNWDGDSEFPIPNIWIGTSVENQKAADERIPHLLKIPAAVRFLSMEPLLGPVDLSPWFDWTERSFRAALAKFLEGCGIHWVIVGGESGHGARPCNLQWIRNIRDQCQAAGVSCFIKQLGACPYTPHPGWDEPHEFNSVYDDVLELKSRKGGNWDEWPEDLRVREFPLAVAGG